MIILTYVLFCLCHLPTNNHLARSPQYVSRTVEKLQVDHTSEAAGLSRIRTIELHETALEGLHKPCFDIRVA